MKKGKGRIKGLVDVPPEAEITGTVFYPDEDYKNADWPKRTEDRLEVDEHGVIRIKGAKKESK